MEHLLYNSRLEIPREILLLITLVFKQNWTQVSRRLPIARKIFMKFKKLQYFEKKTTQEIRLTRIFKYSYTTTYNTA